MRRLQVPAAAEAVETEVLRRLLVGPEFASALLARGAAVSDACHASGFSEVGTFGRALRRQYGQTPSSWARAAG